MHFEAIYCQAWRHILKGKRFPSDNPAGSRYHAIMHYLWKMIFLLGATVWLSGCASLHEVRFTASPSPLDYVQLRMARHSPTDQRREWVRLDLSGSGFLEMTQGSSERVTSSFWQESDDPSWQDIRRDHAFLSDRETQAVFQRLVNSGLFDRKQRSRDDPQPHDMIIVATLGFRKNAISTGRDDYRELFTLLMQRVEQR